MAKFLQALKMPLYFAQIFTGAKSFEKNPILGSQWLNKKGLHRRRVKIAMQVADWRRGKLASAISPDQIAQYKENGFVVAENFLPPDVFKQVLAEINADDFLRHDMLQGQTVTRRASLDSCELETKPGLKAAKNDKRLTDLIRYVASHGGQPFISLQIVMALPGAKEKADPQVSLHSDTFHPTAKCWLFLKDVGVDDGPFCYVKSSHLVNEQRYDWENAISQNVSKVGNKYSARGSMRVSQSELADMQYPEPTKMIVKANTLVVADTHGFHARCFSPNSTTRIEIYGSLRRNPFLPYIGLHPLSLPFLRERTNKMVVDGLTVLQKYKIRANPWKAEGRGKVDEWPSRLTDET